MRDRTTREYAFNYYRLQAKPSHHQAVYHQYLKQVEHLTSRAIYVDVMFPVRYTMLKDDPFSMKRIYSEEQQALMDEIEEERKSILTNLYLLPPLDNETD